MNAVTVAIVYFGSFLAVGAGANWTIRRWMGHSGLDLRDIQADLEPRRGSREVFLLGAWRRENSDS